ncbi:MAG: DJ-1/PfpI family protein [Acholeplasmatales bacterium]|jgi:4-methyl-5(b-hydroxyethyl)-thiazole monophosphate biosynthesis|nr:DJ-1/PfpI family protein [Acholeplasmatales bacterium]
MKGLILFSHNMEDSEAIFTRDLLLRGGLSIQSFSFESRQVTTAYGLTLNVDLLASELGEVKNYDFLVIPGGKYVTMHPPFKKALQNLLSEFHRQNKLLAAICAAPCFLDGLAILGNYTCYGNLFEEIKDGHYQRVHLVQDGNLITAQSAGYIMEFSLQIIRTLLGEAKVEAVKKQLLLKI